MLDLSKLTTEARNPRSHRLSSMSISEAVALMNDEDLEVVACVKRAIPSIVQVIERTTRALKEGGRIVYMGAGTSGRLGVLDAVECPPTFGVDYDTVIGLIAGGDAAFVKAIEGAEDSLTQAAGDLKAHNLASRDVVIGIAASGRTPYVAGALNYAHDLGCATAAIVCSKDAPLKDSADVTVEIVPGPEVVTGSTRLKAGTATKMVLNMISTVSMVQLGKVYSNYMVDVKMTNEKLVQRAHNIVCAVTSCTYEEAHEALAAAHNDVKAAIVMLLCGCTYGRAKELLADHQGKISEIEQEVVS